MAEHKNQLSRPCKDLEENLVLFHYGELGEAERPTIQTHVAGCTSCAGYLQELGALMPLTVKTDEPPENFWTDYSRELRLKIALASEKKSWLQAVAAFFQPRLVPALGAAFVVVLALTFTVGKGIWHSNDSTRDDEAMIEVLPVAENLEFFKAMDMLDDLDLLESMGNQGGAA
jgi:putative zinc finger protein